MKTIWILPALLMLSTSVFADRTTAFVDTPVGAAQTGNAYLVRLSADQGMSYGLFAVTDVHNSWILYRASIPPQTEVKDLLGRLCRITAKAVKDEQGVGKHFEVTKVELAEPIAPANGVSPRR